MKISEKERAMARRTYLKRRKDGGIITHTNGVVGKTLCGRHVLWNTIIADIFTCSSCEKSSKRKKDGV
jgi:hypothetical protein